MTLDRRYQVVKQCGGHDAVRYVPTFCGKAIGQSPYSYATEQEAQAALEAFHEDRMEKAA
jgi:hypothetical protein